MPLASWHLTLEHYFSTTEMDGGGCTSKSHPPCARSRTSMTNGGESASRRAPHLDQVIQYIVISPHQTPKTPNVRDNLGREGRNIHVGDRALSIKPCRCP
jgi:hypothetical protein